SRRCASRSSSNSVGCRAGMRAAAAATDGSAGATRPASRSRNAATRSSLSRTPADKSYTSLSTTASSTPAPARNTTRALSRPTGCTADRVAPSWAVPSRTGTVSSTSVGSLVAGSGGAVRPRHGCAARAGQAGELHQLAVLRVPAGRLERRRDAPDRLDRFEGLEQLRHVHAEPMAFRVPAGALHKAARAQPESQAAGDRQRLEPALETHGVVIRRDEGVQLFLLLAHRAALLDVGADRLDPAREVRLPLGGEPLFREPALELLRAAELAEDQVQLAHHQLEQLDLPVEQLEDVGLDGSRSGEVHDVDLALLPYTVQPSNSLLHHHRVPGQVVVHQHVAELQIASFAAGAGSDQHAARIL